jgi:hypothetical protein
MMQLSSNATERIDGYVTQVGAALHDLPVDDRAALLARIRAEIEIDMDLDRTGVTEQDIVDAALRRHGEPAACAERLRAQIAPAVDSARSEAVAPAALLRPCRACKNEVSLDAMMCPKCGAPFPARTTGNLFGYEWKSKATLFGWPLVHIAFGRDQNRRLRVAKGIIAIGQFGIGAITIAQFGIGALFGLGQFVIAPVAVGQFAGGLVALGQFGFGVLHGVGMIAADFFHGIRVLGNH